MVYNHVDSVTVDRFAASLVLHSHKAWRTKATFAAFKHILSTYTTCEEGNANPLFAQEDFVAGTDGPG